MIYNLLIKAQQGNQEAMLELINRFQPLLKKYARKLRYDDAYEDCQLFFIELIKKMDYKGSFAQKERTAVAYIKTAVKNFYNKKICEIFKAKKEVLFSELSQEQRYFIESKMAKQDEINFFTELGLDGSLNAKEKRIVYLVYVKGYSVAEIARVCHKSRQAVNQLKKRALNKLKQIVGTESAK